MEINNITQQFIRNLLIHKEENKKIPVASGMQTIYLDSNMILYVQSFININHIAAIRRFEAEMVTGATIPIPALTYTQVKKDLQNLM